MKFEKLQRYRIHEEIVHQIEEMILQQAFLPGDKLPSEREMAISFGVSRSVIRQALAILKEKELIEVRLGDGTYAKFQAPVSVIAPLAKLLTEERKEIVDPIEVRSLLEPQIARLAAQRASNQDVEELDQFIESQKNLIIAENFMPMELDTAFHLRIAQSTGNLILVHVLESIFNLVEKSRILSLSNERSLKLSLEWHENIVKGIRKKDGEMAYVAMQHHIDDIKKLIISNFPENRR